MSQRIGVLAGIALAILGTLGLAGAGILWTFQGRPFGLGGTVASLVLISISLALLRPLPTMSAVTVDDTNAFRNPVKDPSLTLKRPQASLVGITFAALGTLGLAASGILWTFKGIAFGLTGTITALVSIIFAVPFLWPIGARRKIVQATSPAKSVANKPTLDDQTGVEDPAVEQPAVETTAEAIAKELADQQKAAPPLNLVTFAPEHLLPGNTLPIRRRRPGASIKSSYKGMVEELFRS